MWKAIASRDYLRRSAASIKPDQKLTSGLRQASRADLEKAVSITLQFKCGTQHPVTKAPSESLARKAIRD